MTICITTEGKLKAAENDAVENIVCLIDEALEVSTPEQLDAADAPTEILNDSLQQASNLIGQNWLNTDAKYSGLFKFLQFLSIFRRFFFDFFQN